MVNKGQHGFSKDNLTFPCDHTLIRTGIKNSTWRDAHICVFYQRIGIVLELFINVAKKFRVLHPTFKLFFILRLILRLIQTSTSLCVIDKRIKWYMTTVISNEITEIVQVYLQTKDLHEIEMNFKAFLKKLRRNIRQMKHVNEKN